LEAREYYANSQNAFWHIMGELFRAGPKDTRNHNCFESELRGMTA
jgi:G:T/U-mismatch repair DNA glycosylase